MIIKNFYREPLCEVLSEENDSVLCQSITTGATNESFTEGTDFTI